MCLPESVRALVFIAAISGASCFNFVVTTAEAQVSLQDMMATRNYLVSCVGHSCGDYEVFPRVATPTPTPVPIPVAALPAPVSSQFTCCTIEVQPEEGFWDHLCNGGLSVFWVSDYGVPVSTGEILEQGGDLTGINLMCFEYTHMSNGGSIPPGTTGILGHCITDGFDGYIPQTWIGFCHRF